MTDFWSRDLYTATFVLFTELHGVPTLITSSINKCIGGVIDWRGFVISEGVSRYAASFSLSYLGTNTCLQVASAAFGSVLYEGLYMQARVYN